MISRRDFLKIIAATMAPLVASPLRVFAPPRESFIIEGRKSLMNLYSHLGVLPHTQELGGCEGRLLEVMGWDGTGYPCLIQNACTFGPNPPRVLIYDFDLWNFRHDDDLQPLHDRPDYRAMPGHHAWHAKKRFGAAFRAVIRQGNGMLARQLKLTAEEAVKWESK